MIVGVDCEGMNVGGDFILVDARDGTGKKIVNAISAEDKPKFIEGGERRPTAANGFACS